MLNKKKVLWATTASALSLIALVVLAVLGVSLTEMCLISLYLGILLGAGALLVRNQSGNLPDKICFCCCAFSAGIFLSYTLGIFIFHYMFIRYVNLEPDVAVRLGTAMLLVIALAGFKATRRGEGRLTNDLLVLTCCLFISLIVAVATHFGYGNNAEGLTLKEALASGRSDILPNWGEAYDFNAHIRDRTAAIYDHGFPPPPPEKFAHRGIQLLLLNYNLSFGSYDLDKIVHFLKVLSLLSFFCITYMTFNISHYIYGLNKQVSCVVAVSALIFSPLKLPLLQLSPTYRGFFSASGTFYHNITQLSQYAVAVCGVYLLLQAIKNERQSFAAGCFLISASFFLKPSVFTVLAPAIMLLIPFYRAPFEKDKLLGYFSLLCVPLLWRAYTWMLPVSTPPLNPTYRFFEGYKMTLEGRFPDIIFDNTGLLVGCVFALSFAAFLPAIGAALVDSCQIYRASPNFRAVYRDLRDNLHYLLPVLALMLALVSSMVLAGPGYQINFKWSAAAAYVLALPVLVAAIVKMKSVYWRRLSWGIYGLHLYVGLAYLFHYAYNSTLF
jgi:hypothetical protein